MQRTTMSAADILILLSLGLEDFHDDLLFLNQEGADNLLPHGLVTEDTTVGSEDGLLTPGETRLLLVAKNINIKPNISISIAELTWQA